MKSLTAPIPSDNKKGKPPPIINLKSLEPSLDVESPNSQNRNGDLDPDFHKVKDQIGACQNSVDGVISDQVSTNDQTNIEQKKMNPILE